MKRCELCKGKARVHCESDQASLCWDCDAKVHSANFLVARHSRNLLCHVCQSPTPWCASGAKLSPTFSACKQCANAKRGDESGEEEEVVDGDEEVIEVVEENQVVPWPPPPPAEEEISSSSNESVSDGEVVVSSKRRRIQNASSDLHSDENQNCESVEITDSLSRTKTKRLQNIQTTESVSKWCNSAS